MSDFEIVTIADRSRWEGEVQRFDHDVYHTWAYHEIASRHSEGAPHLILWGEGETRCGLPLLIRPIPGTDHVDATSVYGYPGPLNAFAPPEESGAVLSAALESLGVVTAFSRLNPLIDNTSALEPLGAVVPLGATVSLDLSMDPGERLAACSRSARRRIRQLENSGARVFVDDDLRYLDHFVRMYRAAMERVDAGERYDFAADRHRELQELLGDSMQLVVCARDDDLLAAGIYFVGPEIVQAHLAADNPEFRGLAPQRLEIHGAANIYAEQQRRRLHLGGGVGSSDDSLLDFKRGFGGAEHVFSVWRHVVRSDVHAELMDDRFGSTEPPDGFFPAYRCPTKRSRTRTEAST